MPCLQGGDEVACRGRGPGHRMRGGLGEAGMSLPVQVRSVQCLASRMAVSPAGVTVTWRLKRG
jgi:hypothetical protein